MKNAIEIGPGKIQEFRFDESLKFYNVNDVFVSLVTMVVSSSFFDW